MRHLAFIFSIYLLALSLMPCSDVPDERQSNAAKRELIKSYSHQADRNDICSPFCTCNCCSTSVSLKFIPYLIRSVKPNAGTALQYPIRDFTLVSNFYGNIWQPPKINA